MFHKAIALELKDGTLLEVTFQNGEVKSYDMSVLFSKYPQLEKLKNRELFLKGKLAGSYGIVWNDELDIEVETIYEDGMTIRSIMVSPQQLIGYEISELRAKLGLSQAALAAATGIDQSDISKIERGVANPSINTLIRIADAMEKKLQIHFV